jgi:hypothetical protein
MQVPGRINILNRFAAGLFSLALSCNSLFAETGDQTLNSVLDSTRVPIPANTQVPYGPTPGEPAKPDPDSYGLDPETGIYKHPSSTPMTRFRQPNPFPGSLDYLDQNQYSKNVTLESYYPATPLSGHTWQIVIEMEGRRYLYDYESKGYLVLDVTDPRNPIRVAQGNKDMGAMTVKRHRASGKLLAIGCYSVPRYSMIYNKWTNPEQISNQRDWPHFRGVRIREVTGPDPKDWKLLSEFTLDPTQDPNERPVKGSGCIDVPTWLGDKYLFLIGSPDDTFANIEYRSTVYSAIHQAYDISDPTKPKLLGLWWAPGQRMGEEEEYNKNPRAGTRTAWNGGRMAMFLPKAVEDGGTIAYTAMGGLGLYSVDISDPSNMKTMGHLEFPMSIAGNEGDNVEISKIASQGRVYFSGYASNDDCYEPEKPIYSVDVTDPANMKIAGTMPRPKPPADAPFTDYCQRRGVFAPKRPGYIHLEYGSPHPDYLIYSYYNAGMQMFDVSDPDNPEIAAYFTPKMIDPVINSNSMDDYHFLVRAVFMEWDRNLIWVFSNHGIYGVSSPLLGKPIIGLPTGNSGR